MSSTIMNSPQRSRSVRGWAFYLLVTVVAVVCLAAIVGESYEALSRASDQRMFRRWGDLIDVGGYRLNLNCLGAGAPTVVFDNGLGLPGAEWSLVQPDVAEFTQVCSYDRAGYAWSDAGRFPRTSGQISKELHELLQKGGAKPPYVLVGHSFGGYNVRVYAHQYPSEVAGMILVEAAHDDQFQRLPAQFQSAQEQQARTLHRWQPFMPVLIHLGVERLRLQLHPPSGVPSDVLREIRYLQLSSRFFDAMVGEMDAMQQSLEEVRASGTLGDKPLLVLSGANAGDDLPAQLNRDQYRKIWLTEIQPSLTRLSSRGKRTVVPNAGHLLPLQQPDAVVDAIHQMVSTVREK